MDCNTMPLRDITNGAEENQSSECSESFLKCAVYICIFSLFFVVILSDWTVHPYFLTTEFGSWFIHYEEVPAVITYKQICQYYKESHQ